MKKSIFLFFAAILCAIGMNAAIPSKLYLDASDWGYANARYAAYFMPQNSFVDMTKATGEVSVFEVAVPASQTKVIFVRMNGATTENNWNNGTKWNQTGDLTIPTDGKNKFKPSGWDGATTTWSTYTYTPPTFYIAGDFVTPTWSENAAANKMDYADGVFSKSYDNVAASPHQFKITNGTWTNAIGYNQNTCSGTNCKVEGNGENIQFTPLAEGTVTITYTLADGKVHITCPEPPAAEFNITYPATQTNYTLVAGPAKAQTGTEVSFTATPADGYVLNVTYNGNAITGNNNVYAFMMPAADVTIAIEAVVATTIYYVDNNSWGNANAYMWNDSGSNGWPGVTMTAAGTVGEHNYAYYSVSFAQGAYTSVIFSNNGSNQTADQTIETAKPYFYDGAWYTWDELLAKLAAPVVTYDYYIAGPLAGGWSATQMGMEKVAEGQYTCEFTKDAGDYQFKVTNGKWSNETGGFDCADVEGSYEEVSHVDGNVNVKLTSTTTFTVKFDSNTKKISFEGLTVAAPAPTFDYYIVGSFNGNDPKKAENGMTLDGTVYKATVTLAAGDNTLKVTDGTWDKTWGANELGAAYEEVSNPNDGYNNIKITLAAEKTITVIFDATAGKITFDGLTPYVAPLTYTVTVPAGTEKCYIAGNMNGWAFQEMEAVTGETNKFTITIVGAKETDEYKYACQADWAYAEVIDGGGNRTQWTALDNVTAWNAPAEPVEMASVVLMGVDGDWATGVEMELNPNDANEYMLLCQPITADEPIKIKAVDTQSTVTWCAKLADTSLGSVVNDADGNENIVLEEGKYDFYYKVAENEVWIGTCDETPEVGGEMDLLVTDLVIMEDSDAQMALLMGTDGEVGIEFALMLTGYTGEYNKEYQLSADESVLSLSGEESLVSGSLTKISDPDLGDVYQGVVYATLMGMYWQFNLTMYYVEVPAIEINVNNATVVEELYDNFVGGTGSEWSLSGNWTYEGEPATVKVTIYDEVDKSVPQKEMQVDVETDYGFVQGNAMVIIDATTMTVQGELSNQMSGAKYKFNISGALPTCPTIRLSIADNKNVLAATNNTKVNVIVNRSFEANDGYYTLCLPFDMQASVVGKAYQISTITEHAAQGINVEFTEVTTMLAGQPYLIKPNDLDNFTVEAVTIKNTTTPVTVTGEGISITMQGMFNRDGKTNGLYWVGNGGYLYNDDVYTNGLCAYFNISTPSGVAPRMRVVTKEDAETGVEDIFSTDAPVKAIVNGQLIIIRDGEMYNVQGQLVK